MRSFRQSAMVLAFAALYGSPVRDVELVEPVLNVPPEYKEDYQRGSNRPGARSSQRKWRKRQRRGY